MPKVLLIEDDETMSSLLTILLQFEGYAVSTSTDDSPNDLFEAMRRDKPDLILLDVHLRQGNGIEILRTMRNTPDLQDLHVLMTSGLNYKEECLQAGADNFLLKPYMPDELINLIKRIIGNNKSG
jgi:DNA-binding response OmpR family regulator